jgi:hypothetical protein
MNREQWIEDRADELCTLWNAVYPVMSSNSGALLDIARREAEAEYDNAELEAAMDRAQAMLDARERDDERRMDYV